MIWQTIYLPNLCLRKPTWIITGNRNSVSFWCAVTQETGQSENGRQSLGVFTELSCPWEIGIWCFLDNGMPGTSVGGCWREGWRCTSHLGLVGGPCTVWHPRGGSRYEKDKEKKKKNQHACNENVNIYLAASTFFFKSYSLILFKNRRKKKYQRGHLRCWNIDNLDFFFLKRWFRRWGKLTWPKLSLTPHCSLMEIGTLQSQVFGKLYYKYFYRAKASCQAGWLPREAWIYPLFPEPHKFLFYREPWFSRCYWSYMLLVNFWPSKNICALIV